MAVDISWAEPRDIGGPQQNGTGVTLMQDLGPLLAQLDLISEMYAKMAEQSHKSSETGAEILRKEGKAVEKLGESTERGYRGSE